MKDSVPHAEKSAASAFTFLHASAPVRSIQAASAVLAGDRIEPPIDVARRLVGVTGAALLLYLTWTGATGFLRQWPHATGVGQQVQTCGALVYSLGALFSVVTTVRLRPSARVARRAWVVGATLAGGLAPTVWGGAAIWLSAITGVASLGVAIGLLWMLGRGFPSAQPKVRSS